MVVNHDDLFNFLKQGGRGDEVWNKSVDDNQERLKRRGKADFVRADEQLFVAVVFVKKVNNFFDAIKSRAKDDMRGLVEIFSHERDADRRPKCVVVFASVTHDKNFVRRLHVVAQ